MARPVKPTARVRTQLALLERIVADGYLKSAVRTPEGVIVLIDADGNRYAFAGEQLAFFLLGFRVRARKPPAVTKAYRRVYDPVGVAGAVIRPAGPENSAELSAVAEPPRLPEAD